MKISALLTTLALTVFAATLGAADKKKNAEEAGTTVTFYISNVQCSSCVEAISGSLNKLKAVKEIDGLTGTSGYANITFDPTKASYHEVANAIYKSEPVHGEAYVAGVKMRIPAYSKGDNAAKVDAVFAKLKDKVEVKVLNKKQGELLVSFQQLKVDRTKTGPQGVTGDELASAIHDAGIGKAEAAGADANMGAAIDVETPILVEIKIRRNRMPQLPSQTESPYQCKHQSDDQ